jgi:hypothetical protein
MRLIRWCWFAIGVVLAAYAVVFIRWSGYAADDEIKVGLTD